MSKDSGRNKKFVKYKDGVMPGKGSPTHSSGSSVDFDMQQASTSTTQKRTGVLKFIIKWSGI